MGKDAINIEAIIDYLKSQPVKRLWLFGSYAQGEANVESDVDLLIEYDYNQKIGLFKHAEILLELEDLLKKEVDLVPIESLRETLRHSVDSSKIMIYERNY